MSTHWLSGITDLFTCDTDDLAELARVAGFEPKEFYRGTLSDAEIDQLEGKRRPHVTPPALIEIDGHLGIGEAWFPRGLQSLSLPVTIFNNEIALAEAVLTGQVKDDIAAVIQTPLYADDGAAGVAAALEIVQAAGKAVLLITAGPLLPVGAQVPVVTNFENSVLPDGPISRLSEGDRVVLDPTRQWIEVVAKPIRSRSVMVDHLTSAIRQARRENDPEPRLRQALQFGNALMEEALPNANLSRKRAGALPYIQLLLVLSRNAARCARELSQETHRADFGAEYENVDTLLDAMQRSASTALRRGQITSALEICGTQLNVMESLPKAFFSDDGRRPADVHALLGDIHARARGFAEATKYYLLAFDDLRYADETGADHRSLFSLATIFSKLADVARHRGHIDEEAHYLALAADNAQRADYIFADRDFRKFKAGVHLQKANFHHRMSDELPALRECNESIDAYLTLMKRNTTQEVLSSLIRAFGLKSNILWKVGDHEEGVIARVVAIHVAYIIFMTARAARSSKMGLKSLVEATQALKSYVKSSHEMGTSTLVREAQRLLSGVDVNADLSSGHEWLTGVVELQHFAADFLPRGIHLGGTVDQLFGLSLSREQRW